MSIMSILIIVPTYNEKDNIEMLVNKILSLNLSTKILIVDDNSPDKTGEVANRIAKDNSRVFVLHRHQKSGLGKAYLEGFKYAVMQDDIQYIMQMDADLSHDPSYIPKFLEAINDCDVVIGSRFFGGKINIVNWPIYRLILSYGASRYIALFTWLSLSDPTSGYKLFRKSALERVLKNDIISNGYAFQIEVNYICKKLGLKIKEIPIIFYDRNRGSSKMQTFRAIMDAVTIVWRLKFRRNAP